MAPLKRNKYNKIKISLIVILITVFILLLLLNNFFGTKEEYTVKDIPSIVLEKYFFLETNTEIPWYYFASIDIVEENNFKAEYERYKKLLSIYQKDKKDIHKTLIKHKNKKYSNKIIEETKRFKELDAIYRNKAFPIPKKYTYEYKNGWGDDRTYGGDRKHEGIDIIAKKGIPIQSVGKGVIEKIGWNELGGWRIGIRGQDNMYYYYAHLDSYGENMKQGRTVNKGDIIGYVGSTGYGPEGTSGKFVNHLHFGIYKNNKAINPYPFLRGWEKNKG